MHGFRAGAGAARLCPPVLPPSARGALADCPPRCCRSLTAAGSPLQGVSYGKPAACLLYDLAYHLGQDSAHMLWLALVGLTDHLVHNRCNGACMRVGCVAGPCSAPAGAGGSCGSAGVAASASSAPAPASLHQPASAPRHLAPAALSRPQPTNQPTRPACSCPAADKYTQYYLHYEGYVSAAGHLDVADEREAAEGEGVAVRNNQITCRIL